MPSIRIAACVAAAIFAAAPASSGQVAGLAGTVIVTNKAPSTATVIDVASGRTLASIRTGNGPHEIVVSKDGRTAVVSDYSGPPPGRTLTVIDLPTMSVARTIDMGAYPRPHGIVFLKGDSLVVVTSETTGFISVVNVRTGVVQRAVATQGRTSHMVGVTADESRAYTGNIQSNTVSELDLRGGLFLRSFDVPAQPEGINVTPDGAEVWVGSNTTGKVTVIEPATGRVTTVAEGFGFPYRMLFTPDTRTVCIPDFKNEELRVLDRATKRELGRISFPGGGPQGITISPDGKYVFLSLSTEGRVAIVDLAARRVVGYVAAGDAPDGIAYTTRVYAKP